MEGNIGTEKGRINAENIKRVTRYRWVIWGVLALAYLVVFFHRLAAGVVRQDLVEAFGITGTTFANISGTYFYAYMLMQIPSGILADSLGARKTVTVGMLFAGVGSVIFGLAPTVGLLYVGRLLVGLGVSVVFIAVLKVLSEWYYEREFGTMSGLTTFVGNMGGVIAQTPLALMVAYFTWRSTFVAIGVMTLGIALLSYIIIRNTPQDMGLPSIKRIEKELSQRGQKSDTQEKVPGSSQEKNVESVEGFEETKAYETGQAEVAKSTEKDAPEAMERPTIMKGLLGALSNWRTWPGFIGFTGFFGSFVVLTGTWGQSYLVDVYGMDPASAPNYLTAAVFGLAIGGIIIGKISDKVKRRKSPMVLFAGVYLLTWGIIVFSNGGMPPVGILYPLFFLLGFSCAAFILGWACAKEVNHPALAGIAMSIVNIGGFLGGAVLPTMIGRVFDNYVGVWTYQEIYQRAFLYCFIAVLIGFIATFFVKETRCKNIYFELKEK